MTTATSSRGLRCWAEISAPALRHNLRVVRGMIPAGTRIMAVVKANAYGHGAVPLAKLARQQGVEWLAVANAAELAELRAARVGGPVMLLSAFLREELPEALRQRAAFCVSSLEEAKDLATATRKAKARPPEVHIKIDTGMTRLGLWHEDALAVIPQILKVKDIIVTGLFTHFARSDDHAAMTQRQFKRFADIQSHYPHLLTHLANSHGLLGPAPYAGDMVRLGISLYGSSESPEFRAKLRAPMTWKARVTHLKEAGAGRTVSYGATYTLPKQQRLAVLGVGYADGYPRLLSNRGEVLLHGVRCPIRGRVTMDQIVVDVTKLGGKVRLGDAATLLGGPHKGPKLEAEELAQWARTISYEIYTNLSYRVPRVFKGF